MTKPEKRKPQRAKLTKRFIDSRRYGGGSDIWWDTEIPGLGLRVYPSGKKAFVLSYRNARGTKRLLALGRYGTDLTLDQARERAIKQRGRIADGADPVAERKTARSTALTPEATFRQVVESFVEKHAKLRQRTWKETERTFRVTCAPWLDRPISDIGKADAYDLLDGFIADGHGYKAGRTLSWIRALWRWAAQRDIVPAPIMDGVKISFEEAHRTRHYSDDEVKAVWEAADSLTPVEGGFVKLTLLLGVRRSELAGMRRSEFDDPEHPTLWTVPPERVKQKKSTPPDRQRVYVVPLPKLAQRIIKGLPKTHNDLVFPSVLGDRPIVPSTPLRTKVRKASKVPDWTFHACRDTAATWLQTEGHSEYEVGLVLNHSSSGITSRYTHGYPVALKRDLLEKWAQHVAQTVQPKGAVLLS